MSLHIYFGRIKNRKSPIKATLTTVTHFLMSYFIMRHNFNATRMNLENGLGLLGCAGILCSWVYIMQGKYFRKSMYQKGINIKSLGTEGQLCRQLQTSWLPETPCSKQTLDQSQPFHSDWLNTGMTEWLCGGMAHTNESVLPQPMLPRYHFATWSLRYPLTLRANRLSAIFKSTLPTLGKDCIARANVVPKIDVGPKSDCYLRSVIHTRVCGIFNTNWTHCKSHTVSLMSTAQKKGRPRAHSDKVLTSAG